MVKVSVIIPTYHRAECISRAVDSVLSQTLSDIEVIVVDDNGIGTDYGRETEKIMSQYRDNKKVIYIQHEVNMNGSAARNTGIRRASGEYISFLDDDDVYLPQRLELMTKCMDDRPLEYGACYTAYIKHMPNGKTQKSIDKFEGDVYLRALMRSFSIGSGSNLFYRRTAIDEVGFWNESFLRNQDLEYNLRILEKYKVAYVDVCLLEIYYDFRTVTFTYQQSLERETLFRNNFKNHLDNLSEHDRRNVVARYDIEWTRYLITNKHYLEAFKVARKSKIPVRVWWRYFMYLMKRYIHNTSNSFVPNI